MWLKVQDLGARETHLIPKRSWDNYPTSLCFNYPCCNNGNLILVSGSGVPKMLCVQHSHRHKLWARYYSILPFYSEYGLLHCISGLFHSWPREFPFNDDWKAKKQLVRKYYYVNCLFIGWSTSLGCNLLEGKACVFFMMQSQPLAQCLAHSRHIITTVLSVGVRWQK